MPKLSPLDEFIEFIFYVKKRKISFAVVFTLFLLTATFYYYKHTVYSSLITVSINQFDLQTNLEDLNLAKKKSDATAIDHFIIGQLVYSDEMLSHLCDFASLHLHYGLKDLNGFNRTLAMMILRNSIDVSYNNYGATDITVRDKLDYNVAANLANEIGRYLNIILKNKVHEAVERKSEINALFSDAYKKNAQNNLIKIDSLIRNLQELTPNKNPNAISPKLDLIYKKIEAYLSDASQAFNYSFIYSQSMRTENLPSVTIIQSAFPDPKTKTKNIYLNVFLIFVLSLLASLVIFYLMNAFRASSLEIRKAIFSKEYFRIVKQKSRPE